MHIIAAARSLYESTTQVGPSPRVPPPGSQPKTAPSSPKPTAAPRPLLEPDKAKLVFKTVRGGACVSVVSLVLPEFQWLRKYFQASMVLFLDRHDVEFLSQVDPDRQLLRLALAKAEEEQRYLQQMVPATRAQCLQMRSLGC